MEKTDWTMDFSTFVEFMREKVQICLGDDAFVESKEILKGNETRLQALQITQDATSLCPVIYCVRLAAHVSNG